MKKISLIILFAFTACTMTLSPNARAKYVVEHYLDSINAPVKIELTKFIKIEAKDIDNSDIISHIESRSKTDSEKNAYRKLLNNANDMNMPNGFYCVYRINGADHVTVIRLDSTFTKVVRATGMHN